MLHKVIDQISGQHFRETRNIINGLFGIQLTALTTGLGQGINQMTLELQQPRLKNGKQTGWTSPNNEDVGFNG